MGKYRFDKRSKAEFIKDIKEGTETETKLLNLWLDYIENQTGERPSFNFTGCGEDDGEFLEDKDVTTDSDYHVDGFGLVEVKFSKKKLNKVFHLKINQVKSYVKQGACILMVNGSNTDEPTFAIISNKALSDIMKTCKTRPWAGFGNKLSYIVPLGKFCWRQLLND